MNDIYGTDIRSDWSFNDNGDINLVRESSNLGQAICNRLNADLDTYSIFYKRYGGELFEYMGELNHPTIHEYIRIEIEHILEQEPRIQNVECTVNKTDNNIVECNLMIRTIQDEEEMTFNLVLNSDSSIQINQI